MDNEYRKSFVPSIILIIVLFSLSACKANENKLILPSQYSNANTPLNVYLTELSKTRFFQGSSTQGSYLFYHEWYKEHAPKHRMAFRFLGIIVVLLSVLLPVVVALEDKIPKQKYIIISISLIIAIATGINSFYRFDTSWKGYISAQMQLESELSAWEAGIAGAKAIPDHTEQLQHAKLETDHFINGITEIIKRETTGYFEVQKMPKNE